MVKGNDARAFCGECGSAVSKSARFCPRCGRVQHAHTRALPRWRGLGSAVFLAFVGFGALAFYQLRSNDGGTSRAVPGSPSSAAAGAEQRLPAEHPPLELPAEALAFLDELEKKTEAAPDDAGAWRRLAAARYRAGLLDSRHLPAAREALDRVLELEPDDDGSLRLQANVAYEMRDFAEAERLFRRYLEKQHEDPGARTDLASTILFQNRVDEAIEMYSEILAAHPDFAQAHLNYGIALHAQGNPHEAMAEFRRARELAEDDNQRAYIDRIIAAAEGRSDGGSREPAREIRSNASSEFQRGVDRLLIDHRIVGPRVASIDWTGDSVASVHLAGFPMDRMPPVVRNKFKSTMNEAIADLARNLDVDAPVQIALVDDQQGNVMDTLDGKELIGAFDEPKED